MQAIQTTAGVTLQSAVAEAEEKLRPGHEAAMANVERQLTAAK